MTKLVFGGAIAIILLGLYAYSVIYGLFAVNCLTDAAGKCTEYKPELTFGITTVLDVVGGLVSALVISELAVTKPTEAPATRFLATDATEINKNVVVYLSIAYISAWLILGLISFVVGFMQHPDVVPALTSSAKTWFGLAVAAGYSYFGISRD